jgi:hypothetical protein
MYNIKHGENIILLFIWPEVHRERQREIERPYLDFII